jgi:hypothetical protein
VQAAGELAQLAHREVELGARAGASVSAASGRRARAALEHAQLERERHEPLLGAVVEVALEAAALLHPRLEDPQPRGAELLARLGALEPERDELGEVAERRSASAPSTSGAADATSRSPHVRPPTTIGAATAAR